MKDAYTTWVWCGDQWQRSDYRGAVKSIIQYCKNYGYDHNAKLKDFRAGSTTQGALNATFKLML